MERIVRLHASMTMLKSKPSVLSQRFMYSICAGAGWLFSPKAVSYTHLGTFILVMSYNNTKIRYFDPLKEESVQAERSSMEREFKKAGSVFYSYAK